MAGPIETLAAKVAVSRRVLARDRLSENATVDGMIREALERDVQALLAKIAWHRDGAPERRSWREYLQVAA